MKKEESFSLKYTSSSLLIGAHVAVVTREPFFFFFWGVSCVYKVFMESVCGGGGRRQGMFGSKYHGSERNLK